MTCPHCGKALPLTSQRRWQLAQQRAGNCIACGKPRNYPGSRNYCKPCCLKRTQQAKVRYWGGDKQTEPVRKVG